MTFQNPPPPKRPISASPARDGEVARATNECLERSRRLLHDTGEMVDAVLQGKPLRRKVPDLNDGSG